MCTGGPKKITFLKFLIMGACMDPFCTSHVFGKKNTGIYFLCFKYIPARNSGGVGGSETRRITGSVPNGCLLTAPAILKHFAFHKI